MSVCSPSVKPTGRSVLLLVLSFLLAGAGAGLVPPLEARGATPVGAGTFENTSGSLTYSGTWGTSSSSQDSSGSVSTLAAVGYTELTFQETSVKLIARTSNYYGIANIYLDGTQVATLDQYSPTTTYKTVAYTSPQLSYGVHTLRVERAGTKNDASTGRTINIDAIVVTDTRAPATPTGLSATPDGAGARLTWSASSEDDLAGYLVHRATGTSTTYTTLTSSPVTELTYTDPALNPGATYRYRVSAVDKSGNESSRTVDSTITAHDTAAGAGTVENTAPAVAYSGSWLTSTSTLDSGGSVGTLAGAGYAQLAFRETSVKLVARTSNYYGIANVYLDGALVDTIDQYSASTAYRTTVYTAPTLQYGTHTLRIERTGNKNDASTGRTINIDAFVVADSRAPAVPSGVAVRPEGSGARLTWAANSEDDLAGYLVERASGTSGTYTQLTDDPVTDPSYLDPALNPGGVYRYRIRAVDTSGNQSARTADRTVTADDVAVGAGTTESTSTDVTYSGSWSSSSSSLDSGGSVATLAGTGYAQIAFRETSVKLVARTSNYYGIANIYLDGTQVATLDQYSPTTTYKTVAYTSPQLSYGVHTLRVERAGTKNDASTGRTINIDAFVVTDSRAPASPTGLSADNEGSGARLTWTANSEDDLVGYHVYRAAGTDTTYTQLTETPVGEPSYLDPALTPDTTYRYRIAAVDASGNSSSRTGDVTLSSQVTVVGPGTVENTSDAITYTGSWTTATSSSDSGGSVGVLAAPGYAQIAFRETSIKLVARTTNYYGIADVFLDGTLVGSIDQYSETAGFKSIVYTSPTVGYGTHTLRVERTGNKNEASAGRSINVDSFLVPDSRAPGTPTGLLATVEGSGVRLAWDASGADDLAGYVVYRAADTSDTFTRVSESLVSSTSYLDGGLSLDTPYRYRVTAVDASGNESGGTTDVGVRSAVGAGTHPAGGPSVVLTGTWADDVDPTTQSSQGRVISSAGTASLTFLESGVRWIGSTGPTGGIARVLVDGELVTSVDQYSATKRTGVTLFEAKALGSGAHTIKVVWTSERSSGSGSPTTSVAAFVVPDATAPPAPRSVWALPVGNGIDVEWDESFGGDATGYRVYRAKGAETMFSLLTSTPQSDTSYLDANLLPGVSYRYRITALDENGNESARSEEASAITALSTGTVENTSPAITYSTPWTVTSSTRDSGGSYALLAAPGDARFTFSGTGIKWVTRTNNFSGIGQVYIDGVAVARVDLYSPVQQHQQVVYATNALADGTHSIRIERTGTLNPASTGRNLTLDAFVVTDSTAPPSMPKAALTNTRLGVDVAWTASTAKDVAAYNLLRTDPDGSEIVLDRLPPTQLSFLDVGLTAGTTYGYRVTAIDSSGNESTSDAPVAVRTPASPAPVRERYANCPTATRTVTSASTLQTALKAAQPGDVIVLAPGVYTGYFSTSVVGTQAEPVWICGPRNAVVDFKDPSTGVAFSLAGASWVTLTGMTVQNVQKGVVATGGSHVTISDVHFHDIGQEAVHLRAYTVDSTVIGNVIERTGISVAQYGEGVYIGSDPGAWCTYSNCAPDRSDRNAVLDNTITATTAEPVDAKAGTSDGLVRGNTVDGSAMTADVADGMIVIKGNSWLVERNTGTTAPANGFTATYSKAEGWGGGNVFVGNRTAVGNDTGYGVWLQRGIGNLVGCDNTAPGAVRVTNLVCQR